MCFEQLFRRIYFYKKYISKKISKAQEHFYLFHTDRCCAVESQSASQLTNNQLQYFAVFCPYLRC